MQTLEIIAHLATTFGLFLAYLELKANHDWNRRQHAMHLVEEWNAETADHRKVIEHMFPGLIDSKRDNAKVTEIDQNKAAAIYGSLPKTKYWEVKFHFVELLNFFELVSSSVQNRVADEDIIVDSFANALKAWHKPFENFIEVVKHNRGYNPWQPYSDFVAYLNAPKKKRSKTENLLRYILPS